VINQTKKIGQILSEPKTPPQFYRSSSIYRKNRLQVIFYFSKGDMERKHSFRCSQVNFL